MTKKRLELTAGLTLQHVNTDITAVESSAFIVHCVPITRPREEFGAELVRESIVADFMSVALYASRLPAPATLGLRNNVSIRSSPHYCTYRARNPA